MEELLRLALNPALLQFPTPVFSGPFNWLVPAALLALIVVSILRSLKSEELVWAAQQVKRIAKACVEWMERNFPVEKEVTVGRLIGYFTSVLLFTLFSIYFAALGTNTMLMGLVGMAKVAWANFALMLLGGVMYLPMRYYWRQAREVRELLKNDWQAYTKKGRAAVALAAVSCCLIATGAIAASVNYGV